MNAKVVKVAKAPKDEKVVKVKTGKSIPVSKFKRAQPSDDSAIVDFLNKANYKMEGKAILDAWINPKDEKKEELVVVVITQDNPDAINDVLYKTDKGIEVVECESMFETFQVHKEARFLN